MIRVLLAAALGLATPGTAVAQIDGRWITEGGQSIVTVERCGRERCGTITRVLIARRGAATTDVNNPDPALRRQPITGLQILEGFVVDGTRWRGRIYDPRSGKTYTSFLESSGAGLRVTGCIAFLCKTQTWQHSR